MHGFMFVSVQWVFEYVQLRTCKQVFKMKEVAISVHVNFSSPKHLPPTSIPASTRLPNVYLEHGVEDEEDEKTLT